MSYHTYDEGPAKNLKALLLALADRNPELNEAGYSVIAAPNEIKAREVADGAARQSGRVLVDVVTQAFLRSWLDRARQHPPDLVAPNSL